MIDTSGITSNVNSVANIILVNPQRNIGITPKGTDAKSFLFHFTGEEVVTLTSDITDHYVEKNTAVQDQIALKPETITTSGYIGELNNVIPESLQTLKNAADRLALLSPYLPSLTSSALIAFNTAQQLYTTKANAEAAANSKWDSIDPRGPKTKKSAQQLAKENAPGDNTNAQTQQQKAFNSFYAWWKARQLFIVQTPWCIFDNMAIQTLRAVQGEDTRMITNFEITFKQMRFAQTTSKSASAMSARLKAQKLSATNIGPTQPAHSNRVNDELFRTGITTRTGAG